MGAKNGYLNETVPLLYRKQILDVMIYTWIDAQRFTLPTITVEDSAISFMRHYKISEDQLSLKKVTETFWRIQKELIDEQKTKNSQTRTS